MKIDIEIGESHSTLRIAGRLDAAWAGHFHAAAGELLRDGRHRIRIDASDLEYLSSAGLRTLLKIRRELDAVNGSLAIVRASVFVRDTLRMSGLDSLLVGEETLARAPATIVEPPVPMTPSAPVIAGMQVEPHELDPGGSIAVRVHAGWTPWARVGASDLREIAFPRPRIGLGIGASAQGATDALGRLGEFVVAAGCLVWLPGDGAESPDFLEQEEQLVPRLHTVQALVGEGAFSHLLRFRPTTPGAVVNIDDLIVQAMSATGAEAVAAVILAEADGLVGAALARSPGLIGPADRPGEFPEIRNWMAFCGERLHRRSQALVVAFACRESASADLPMLATMPLGAGLRIHAHAVAWPFRPFPQGMVDLDSAVRAVAAENSPLGLLHLLADDRPVVGLGRSAFVRGACWCAPLRRSMEAPS